MLPPELELPAAYESAIEDYAALAVRSPAVLAVELCGTISDPGLSDIDLLLVVADYARLRGEPLALARLLNPEAMTPLFTHGPFICLASEYPDFVAHTTLRPRAVWRRDGFAPTLAAPSEEPGDVLSAQAAYVAHLTAALPRARADRHRLLLAGSVRQSLMAVSRSAGARFKDSAAARAYAIASLRRAWARSPDEAVAGAAHLEALAACSELATELAGRIRADLAGGELLWHGAAAPPAGDRDLLAAYSRACFAHGLGAEAPSAGPPLSAGPARRSREAPRFRFIESLLDSQLRHGILAFGGEFPFPVPDLPRRMGAGIWTRRFFKRAAKTIGRLRA